MNLDTSALLTDFYQLTMMGGYVSCGHSHQRAVFDLYFRRVPEDGGFCVAAGLEQALAYLTSLRFTEADIDYLRGLGRFDDGFLAYLRDFRFKGDVSAVEEGTVVFPGEPLMRVSATMPEAQLIESALLNIVNFQTLIATKAARVCHAAGDEGLVLEFGLRRAQGVDGAMSASRAAYVGGCAATSNVRAGQQFGIPVSGTQAHSWIMAFDSEIEAFRAYAKAYPDDTALLVDTYDTLTSGVPNAIRVAREMEADGHHLRSIRIDSGDLAYLSKEARRLLDEAGFPEIKIVASSDLDEHIIHNLRAQGARIDVWGVGTRLVTSHSAPALGGVYKLVAASDSEGSMVPRIKVSSNPEKTTTPGVKQVWRTFDAQGLFAGDIIALDDEDLSSLRGTVRTRHATWLYPPRRVSRGVRIEPLLVPVIKAGRRVYEAPPLSAVRARALSQLSCLRAEHKRFVNADIYWVGLSERLFALRARLIEEASAEAAPPG
ncbi:MAG: nicotinate phosphoribosyltransferase [Proteobacteria bacterium]|nr:nicotinate phosphoribosyltransferase [Pseudomonadota bacterium]